MMFNSEFNSFPPISFVPKSLICIVWYLIWLTLSRLTCKSTNLWKQMGVITKFNQVESKTAFLRNALWEENQKYIPVYVFLVTNCMVSKGKQWSIILFELPEVPCYKELNLHKSLFTLISHDLRVQVVHQTADHSTTITSRL